MVDNGGYDVGDEDEDHGKFPTKSETKSRPAGDKIEKRSPEPPSPKRPAENDD